MSDYLLVYISLVIAVYLLFIRKSSAGVAPIQFSVKKTTLSKKEKSFIFKLELKIK